MYAQDQSSLSAVQDILYSGGAGLELTINRAKVVNLELYGQTMTVRTQAKTVDELLKEKNITPGVDDGMNLGANDAITDQMNLRIWRNGIQTVTTTENIAFSTKTVTDLTKKYGSREVQTTGQDGQKTVIYQILFSRAVSLIHPPDLWNTNMGFIHHHKKIIGEIID